MIRCRQQLLGKLIVFLLTVFLTGFSYVTVIHLSYPNIDIYNSGKYFHTSLNKLSKPSDTETKEISNEVGLLRRPIHNTQLDIRADPVQGHIFPLKDDYLKTTNSSEIFLSDRSQKSESVHLFSEVKKDQNGNTYQDTKFILSNSNLCQNRNLSIVICVAISRGNFVGRRIIRQTWGFPGTTGDSPVALIFFVGSARSEEPPSVQDNMLKEFREHQDIIQGDYIDNYHNLTIKTLSMLQWVLESCQNVKYIVKADDDIYVNIPLLIDVLKTVSQKRYDKPFIIGCSLDHAPPIRNRTSKWYVSRTEYGGEEYPRYVEGGCGYAMTTTAARAIRQVSHVTPLMSMEDVYVTGICAIKARIPVLGDERFSNIHLPYGGKFVYKFLTGGNYTLEDIQDIHQIFLSTSPWTRKGKRRVESKFDVWNYGV